MKLNKSLIFFFKIIVIFSLFFYLIQNDFIDLNILILNRSSQYLFLILLIFLSTITILISALRWYIIMKTFEFKINFKNVIFITYIGTIFNNFLFGAYGGDLVKAYYILGGNKDKKVLLGSTILIDRFFGLIGLSIISAIFLYQIFKIEIDQLALNLLYNYFFYILFVCLILLVIIYLSIKFLNFSINLKKLMKLLLLCIPLSLFLFFIVNYIVYLITNGIFQFDIDFNSVFLSNSLTSFVNAIPITPGGIGFGELAYVKILDMINNTNNIEGLATVIVFFRIINFISSLPGLYFYMVFKRN